MPIKQTENSSKQSVIFQDKNKTSHSTNQG